MECHHELHQSGKKPDYLLLTTSTIIVIFYLFNFALSQQITQFNNILLFSGSIYDLINTMFWGIIIGILFIGLLGRIPREFVIAILGNGKGLKGIFRAALGGVLLDLCSHGILMVGAKLYERGATLGQVMAFLISSPWNSFSLTLILWAMIGFKWMIIYLVTSMIVGCIAGLIFEKLVVNRVLPENPNSFALPAGFKFIQEVKTQLSSVKFSLKLITDIIWNGLKDARMVLRWIFLGVIIAALIRTFMTPETFETWFGPTLAGLGLTVLVATIMEVCSEGTVPVAADIVTRAGAPGNGFAFLMAGVSTDYTEIMVLKETTKSWKVALFLPLVTLPQIITLAWIFNTV